MVTKANGHPKARKPRKDPIITLNDRRNPQPSTLSLQPSTPPASGPVFDAENIQLQRRMRFNPLRTLDPENLSLALDQFNIGILRQAAMLWEEIARRDDTLTFVKAQLENSIAGKPWGVFKKKDADPVEAARHAAALEYFYDNCSCVDAFDRNQRGGRHRLLRQMGTAASNMYAVHHFVWKPQPGKMVEVEAGKAAPVPALTAELELVPLMFFENVSGTLRFLPFGGFGIDGQPLNWEGEWMVTTGPGLMFAASICHVFKRLTFQDWTIFNERYAQAKVLGQTNARKDTEEGRAMAELVENFNGDGGMVVYESQPGDEPPVRLIGPEGTVSMELFREFLDRQDRKITVLFRGSDLRNMSREKDTVGVSAQTDETEALELAHCQNIADACRTFIDANVIRFCFGEGVEPLAYFGLPDMDDEDAAQVRESAGFLADRGALVDLPDVAQRLGITLTENEEEALTAVGGAVVDDPDGGKQGAGSGKTANARKRKAGAELLRMVRTALRTTNAEASGGRWITMSGRHVFIRDGESEEAAVARVTHQDAHDEHDRSVPSMVTLRAPNERAHQFTVGHDGSDWKVKTSHGETLPHKFGSRDAAKQFLATKVQAEIDRRYHADVAAGTHKDRPNISDVSRAQEKAAAEREAARKQSVEINRL